MNATPAPTAKTKEFTTLEGLAYLIGAIGIQLTTTMVFEWALHFYAPAEGAGRTLYISRPQANAMMVIGMFFNALSTLVVGWWSDRTNSRWGRRRPFIIFGSIPYILAFILFFTPPVNGASPLNLIWGLFFIVMVFWGLNCVLVPYFALLPEIAASTEGRVQLGVYNAIGMILGLILGVTSGVLIPIIGVKTTAVIFGLVSLASFQFCGWALRERYKPEGEETPGRLSEIFSQIANAFVQNRPFKIFVSAYTLFYLGFFVIQIVLPDYSVIILGKDEDFVTYLLIPFLLVCFPLIFLIEPSVDKWNKKRVYSAGLLGFTILFPMFGVVGMIPGFWPKFIPMLGLTALAGAPQAIQYVLQGPMIGEIADYDELQTGKRREAIYSGGVTCGMNIAMMLSYVVQFCVYAPFGQLSVDNPAPVKLIGPVTGVLSLLGFLIFLKYPELNIQKKGVEETA